MKKTADIWEHKVGINEKVESLDFERRIILIKVPRDQQTMRFTFAHQLLV